MKNKRRNHSSTFKAKVALSTSKRRQSRIVKPAGQYEIHPNQIAKMEKAIARLVSEIFINRGKRIRMQ